MEGGAHMLLLLVASITYILRAKSSRPLGSTSKPSAILAVVAYSPALAFIKVLGVA
jgi:hypothetical protein